MPCDTIQTTKIHLGNVGDRALLKKAIEGIGWAARDVADVNGGTALEFGTRSYGGIIYADGSTELFGRATRELDRNTIQRAYSVEAVKLASAKFGWKLTATAGNKFVAQRRF